MPTIDLKCIAPRPMATRRLLCIPYAGSGALAFRAWAARLPTHIEAYAVQLPGRENRLREPALDSWPAMMDALIRAVTPLPFAPTAIFGHSLGAVIGLELARWMNREQTGRLSHLFVSGRPWPGYGAGRCGDTLLELSDQDLLQALDKRFGSLATSLAHPDIRDMTLPILRADLRLLDSYRYLPAPALDCPMTVFAGIRDTTTPAEALQGWCGESSGSCNVRMLDGQHFYLDEQCEPLVADIAACLA